MTAPTSPTSPTPDHLPALPPISEPDLHAALAAAWAAQAQVPGNLDAARMAVQARTNLSREDAVRVALFIERMSVPAVAGGSGDGSDSDGSDSDGGGGGGGSAGIVRMAGRVTNPRGPEGPVGPVVSGWYPSATTVDDATCRQVPSLPRRGRPRRGRGRG